MKINNVKVKNFKSLKDIDIELKNLTLITGVNSSGKSSFIQSLLFFKQNIDVIKNINNIFLAKISEFEKSEGFTKFTKFITLLDRLDSNKNINTEEVSEFVIDLKDFVEKSEVKEFAELLGLDEEMRKGDVSKSKAIFNGKYLNLGSESLLFSQDAINEYMVFEINHKAEKLKVEIDSELGITCDKNFNNMLEVFTDNNFNYLNTDRVQPKNTFDFSQKDVDSNSIGINGEYVAHYLAEHRQKELNVKALQHPDSTTFQLLENTYKWLGEISSGVSILASSDASTQSAKLTYQYDYGDNTTNNYSPLNVGFGLTYVLPVIVLILKSKPGDLIIVENPESHLHPAGQSKIAEMCAIAANSGVQIIVETHSDHFLNGIRVATKNGVIAPEKSQIYFFEKEEDGLNTVAHSINIDKEGNLNDYPKGFFDEWDNNLDKLLGL